MIKLQIKSNPYNKNYNLTGLTVNVLKRNPNNVVWRDIFIPVTIVAEYPKFLVGVVQPHRNREGFKDSIPYTITLNKHDISIKEIIIK